MKYFFFLILLSQSLYAEEWRTGDYKIALTKNAKEDWVSESCLKACPLLSEAQNYISSKTLTPEALAGGKNPGSVLCHALSGKVIYLESQNTTLAFCQLKTDTVSLSKLTNIALSTSK